MSKAIISWTGGKDSCLALYHACQRGLKVVGLVTFVPVVGDFLAHPLEYIEFQARNLKLPFFKVPISVPYRESYVNAIQWFKEQHGINCVVTGDIDRVDGFPNWIKECCDENQVSTFFPLWNMSRKLIWQQIIDLGLEVRISYVSSSALDATWLGRIIDIKAIEELEALHRSHNIDICGENGEFHTTVLNVERILTI